MNLDITDNFLSSKVWVHSKYGQSCMLVSNNKILAQVKKWDLMILFISSTPVYIIIYL